MLVACATTHPPTRSGSKVAAEQTPTERYEAYRSALAQASTLEELLPHTSKAVRDEMAKRPPSYRRALLSDLKLRSAEWLRVNEEDITGAQAFLTVEGRHVVDPTAGTLSYGRGKVTLLHEDGAWRVDEEIWTLEGTDTSGITPRNWKQSSVKD